MTKFILHGGGRATASENDDFFREFTNGLTGTTHILLNYFARPLEAVAASAAEDQASIFRASLNDQLEFMTASLDNFAAEVDWADVIYLGGGETSMLLTGLAKTPDLKQIFDHKVVAGSSAGVYSLVTDYYSHDKQAIGQGLGLLSLKALCHALPGDKAIIEKLNTHQTARPVLVLPEFKWVVIYE